MPSELDKHKSEAQDQKDEGENELFAMLGEDDEDLSLAPASLAAGTLHLHSQQLSAASAADQSLYLASSSPDIYRGLQLMTPSDQRNAAAAGEQFLDRPHDSLAALAEQHLHLGQAPALRIPLPRAFASLPVSHSHVFVCKPFPQLVPLLERELASADADAAYDRRRGEWRGVVYPRVPRPAAHFAVYPSSCPALGADRFLLEFVRLSGCAAAFYKMFARVQRALADARVMTRENGDALREHDVDALAAPENFEAPRNALVRSVSADAGTAAAAAGDDDEDDCGAGSDEEMYRPIVSMAAAPFADIHVQGLALLASEASKDAARLLRAAPDVATLLVGHVRASGCGGEVRRLCCAALAELAAEADGAHALVAAGAPGAVARAAAEAQADVTAVEAQRQAARCLLALCAHGPARGAVLAAVQELQKEFDALAERNRDPRLAASIEGVRSALAA